jgi:hypothetical protein
VTTNELQPDVQDVLQVEEPAGVEPVVKVEQQGPVRVQELPHKAAATFNRDITESVGQVPLLRADPRRAQAILIADGAFYVAMNVASAQDPSRMAEWPPLVPLTITATTDVWVRAVTGTANLSVITESWATGEGAK